VQTNFSKDFQTAIRYILLFGVGGIGFAITIYSLAGIPIMVIGVAGDIIFCYYRG